MIPVALVAMPIVGDFRGFLTVWAAGGLAAAVLVDVKARRGR